MWLVHVNHLHIPQQLATYVHSEEGIGAVGSREGARGESGGAHMGDRGCKVVSLEEDEVGSIEEGKGIMSPLQVLV